MHRILSEVIMKKYIRFLFICGILLLLSEIWKQWCLTFLLNNGEYNWWYFPFQLCSIPMYLCLALPWVNERMQRIFLTFLMTFSLLGGIFTFFDTSGMYYPYTPLTLHSFFWHIFLIILGISAGVVKSKYTKNTAGEFLCSVLCYLFCCLMATVFNIVFHPYGSINMFYISPYYMMNQKVFAEISANLGNAVGILAYILATLFGAFLLDLFWYRLSFMKISIENRIYFSDNDR